MPDFAPGPTQPADTAAFAATQTRPGLRECFGCSDGAVWEGTCSQPSSGSTQPASWAY
jgi:hypothetical protein